jgi:meiosis-specific transcription factor NDT80
VDGGAENEYPADSVMSDADRNAIHSQEGYRYYPGPLYEGGIPQGLPLPKIESGTRYSTEPSHFKYESSDAVPGSQWSSSSVGGVGRFQGVETSRGFYPDMAASSYS